MRSILCKVRPFEQPLVSPDGTIGTLVRGFVSGGSFRVSFFELVHTLDTARIDADQWGRYALVRPGTTELPGGWVFEIRPELPAEPSEPLDAIGCEITLRKPAFRNVGVDRGTANFVNLSRVTWSVDLDSSGMLDGQGVGGPAPHDGAPQVSN